MEAIAHHSEGAINRLQKGREPIIMKGSISTRRPSASRGPLTERSWTTQRKQKQRLQGVGRAKTEWR